MSFKTGLAVTVLLVASGVRAEVATDTWMANSGDWNTPANWDLEAVPGEGTNVVIAVPEKSTYTLSLSSVAEPVENVLAPGKGSLVLDLGDAAKLTALGAVTNKGSVTFQGGSYAFGGDLVAGRATAIGDADDIGVAVVLENTRMEVAGEMLLVGNLAKLTLKENVFLRCGAYRYDLHNRGSLALKSGSVLDVTGEGGINIAQFYPNDSMPIGLKADGATVTNRGPFKIGSKNAGNCPANLKLGTYWRQYGDIEIGGVNSGSSLLIDASTMEADGNVKIGGHKSNDKDSQNRQVCKNTRMTVTSGGVFTTTGRVDLCGSCRVSSNNYVEVSGGSTFRCKDFNLATTKDITAQNVRLTVVGGSLFESTGAFVCGGDGDQSSNLGVYVSNSTFRVLSGQMLSLPASTGVDSTRFVAYGTEEEGCTCDFPGGLVIGASKVYNDRQRLEPTVFRIDGASVSVGLTADQNDGASANDFRIGGGYQVTENASNRLEIAGRAGHLLVKHRGVQGGTVGRFTIAFEVPEGGYAAGAAIDSKDMFFNDANLEIDLSRVTEAGEYTLVRNQHNNLAIATADTAEINIVPPTGFEARLVREPNRLAVRVKRRAMVIIVR